MSPQPNPIRVLVIDDDPTVRELVAALLEAEGCTVESADSGEAALTILVRTKPAPDVVLVDVQMPGTTGAQLARKLRHACCPTTLLLAMSGSQPPAQTISLFDGFLLKPFKIKEVLAALDARGLVSHEPYNPPISDIAITRRRRTTSLNGRTSKPRLKSTSISAPAQEAASKNRMSIQLQEAKSAEGIDTTESAGADPVLNETIYRQLAGSIPAPQLQEMYTLCLDDARKRIDGMRTLAAAQDSILFIREAHSIKGGCGMLGATELHRMAAELETNGLEAGRAGGARAVNALDKLSAACDRLERMLRLRA